MALLSRVGLFHFWTRPLRRVFSFGEPMSDSLISFSAALEAVKSGKAIRRAGWNGSGLSVKAQYPDAHSKMSLPYLYIEYPENAKTTPGARCPWLASQTDIMADDWTVIPSPTS